MFRAAVLSIVLTLAVGQNAALLCKVWCHPHESAVTGCHHEDLGTSASVAGDDTCDEVVLSIATFVREDVQRRVSIPDAQHAVAVPRYQVLPSASEARTADHRERAWSLELRPLVTALRI